MSVQLHTLPNGVRVVSENMPSMKSASVGIWVAAGGRHERAEQNGIAHFLEHMAFKGTARRNALQIAEAIEDVGGYMNAYTSREMTAYYARVLEEDVGLAVDVLSDIVLNPAFDAREIEVERHVILQEIGQANDTPDDIIFDWLQEVAYPGQPIGRPILGPTEGVKGFSRADLAGFVEERYQPGNLILSAAGSVDHDTLVKLAEEAFGHLTARPDLPIEGARYAGGERHESKQLEQSHIALAFEAPGYRDPDFYASQIFSTTMGGGMSSRLFQEAREKRGLCYTIFAQTGSYADTGLLTIYAGTSDEELGDLADLTIDEIRRAAEDMTEAEVARARAQMKAGMLMGLESPSSRSERMARLLTIWGRVPDIEETIVRIEAVTTADVRAYAGRLIDRGDPALALYGPLKKAPSLDALSRRLSA